MALTKGAAARKASASESTSWQQPTATESSTGTSRGTGRGAPESSGATAMPQFGSLLVRPDSLTPYTDATNCRHSKRKSTATGNGRSSSGGVRRPMNAFMVWSQQERRQMSAADPTLHNAEISRRLGARWRRLTAAERRPYMDEADRLRLMHAVEFPGYKYTPRKSRRTRTPVLPRRQASQRSGVLRTIASRRSTVSDIAQLPVADAFDSEVSLYFAGGNGSTSATASSSRRSSKRRAVGRRRTATESSGSGGSVSSGRNLPLTPDSSTHCLVDQGPMFRVIGGGGGDVPRVAALSKRARKAPAPATVTSTSRRFEFPAVAFPSDVQLGGVWNDSGTQSNEEDSNDVGALDTPISLEQDALAGCSLFDPDDRRGDAGPSLTGISDLTTSWNDIGGPFYVDYCTPEVAAIVRDDWLEETIHNDALI